MIHTFTTTLYNVNRKYMNKEKNNVWFDVDGVIKNDTSPVKLNETREPDDRIQLAPSEDMDKDTRQEDQVG